MRGHGGKEDQEVGEKLRLLPLHERKGSCENVTFVREEAIEGAIADALGAIQLRPEIVEWTREALLESSREENEFRDASVKSLTARYQKLESFISKAYEDKLEGSIETRPLGGQNRPMEGRTGTNNDSVERAEPRQFNLSARRHPVNGACLTGGRSLQVDDDRREREMVGLVLSNRS